MGFIPLLPKPKKQDWPPKDKIGIHEISDLDYQRNLCENYYKASDFGTPSPLAWAIVFEQRLDRYIEDLRNNIESDFEDAFDYWSLFLKGIYFGFITFKTVNLQELRDIGKIVAAELPEEFDFQFLYYHSEDKEEEEVIGFTYPGIGFVPSVRLRGKIIKELHKEIEKKDVEKASEYFVGWVHTFDEKDQGNILFYTLLYHLAEKWKPGAPKKLPIEKEKLFGQGPCLWLAKGEVEDVISRPQIPLYIGTPIICDQCGYQIGLEEGLIEVRDPEDCRCPQCQRKQDWLGKYSSWLKYNEKRGSYLIYAFSNSPVRRPPYTNYVTYEEDGVAIQSGHIRLKVFGLILSEDALKCTRLIFFKDGEREKRPDLPIRGDYFGLVSLAMRDRNPYLDPMKKHYSVVLDVEGWDEQITIRYESHEYEYEEALLLSWPNFKLEGWNVYYYLLETTPLMNKAGIGLRTLALNGQHHLLDASRGQLNEDFDAFELVFKKKDGKIHKQSGIFNVFRNEIMRGETKLTMGVDFGTSASAVTYQLGDGPIEVLRFTDFTEEVIPNGILSDRVLNSSNWLPTYKIDNNQTALEYYKKQLDNVDSIFDEGDDIVKNLNYFIPSEVICNNPISAESLKHPLSRFRICHVYAARPQGEVIHELKIMDVKGDPKGRYSYEQIVSRYLEMFLILSLATIVHKEQIAGYLHIKASFPRNFDNNKIEKYLGCLENVLGTIDRLTGFEAKKKSYLDESRAAAYSVSAEEGGLRVVMDMGGGTTDIGVFERVEGQFEPIYIESLLYGANGYLRMLAESAELFPKPGEKLDDRLLWLFREIRLRSFKTVVQTHYRGNKHSRDVALDLLLRFYKPIAYFIRCLFEALNEHGGIKGNKGDKKDYKQELITLYLVGNGWRLADAHSPIEESYGQDHKEVLRYLLTHEGFTNLTVTSEPVADDSMAQWPGPKAAVGFGIMKAPENVLYQNIQEACNGKNGIRSILGFDVKFNDGSNTFRDHNWHEKVPCSLETNIYKPVLADLKIPEEWSFIEYNKGKQVPYLEEVCGNDVTRVERPIMSRSILGRFIEHIYLKQLDRDRRI